MVGFLFCLAVAYILFHVYPLLGSVLLFVALWFLISSTGVGGEFAKIIGISIALVVGLILIILFEDKLKRKNEEPVAIVNNSEIEISPFIIKCDPCRLAGDATIVVEAPLFGNVRPSVGDRIFVWTSETRGGYGSQLRGVVNDIKVVAATNLRLKILVDLGFVPHRPLTNADLAPHRSSQEGSPIASLAKNLYFHAHNKIVALTPDEELFLDQYFEPQRSGD